MSKCERCGYKKPVNPLGALFACLGNLMMIAFLNHMEPMEGSWGGVEHFYVNWHWYMWWWSAGFAVFGGAFFLIFTGAWFVEMADGHTTHSH